MLFAVALIPTARGPLRALAPDLANCDLEGTTEQELLPRLRLAMEAEITRLLLTGMPLPDTREGRPPDNSATPAAARWMNLHINMAHLEALARHQRGR
jgi:hypothetical protein